MTGLEFIRDLGIVVSVAAVAGWFCQRIGLSAVVGYLFAGLLVGPHTLPVPPVQDTERIHTLAQLGLLFLMFGIGMQMNLRRLRALGTTPMVATLVGAATVFTATRGVALGLGLGAVQGVFLAGMIVCSSSAVVSKSLLEAGRLHSPAGQLAGAMIMVEDIVVVAVLALLNSYLKFGSVEGGQLGATLGGMGAFVALLAVGGLLLLPRVLVWLERTGQELRTLMVVGLLCLLAFGAQAAGYSLALGSFLLGVVVATTAQRATVERSFVGMRDLFSAVFFVAIGMMIDLASLGSIWWQVLLAAAFVLLARAGAVALGLVVAGQPLQLALEGGLSLTPIGEFSFIIVQLGVSAGVLAAKYQPLVVGVALVTALISPLLTSRAVPIATALAERQPRLLERMLGQYHRWLERAQARRAGNLAWRLGRKRFLQIAGGMAFASGLLLFAPRLELAVREMAGLDSLLPRFSQLIFWCVLGLLVLSVLVAVWRNLSALALLVAEASTRGQPNAALLRPVVENGLRVAGGGGLFLWLAAVSPYHPRQWGLVVAILLVVAVVVALLWRRLVYWHSVLEVRLQESLAGDGTELAARAPEGWDIQVDEVVLPENSGAAGRSLAELDFRRRHGGTVVGVDRQGVAIPNPGPDTVLYPCDRVLLLGAHGQIAAVRSELEAAGPGGGAVFGELALHRVRVPADSPRAGLTLAEANPRQVAEVQIAGIQHGGTRLLNPAGEEPLPAGAELLVLGTAPQVKRFRKWLAGA